MARVGRNEPCPCGSGKKFKRCCALVETTTKRNDLHDLDNRLALAMLRWGKQRFPTWKSRDEYPGTLDHGDGVELALAGPWMLYEQHVEGRPIVTWFYEELAATLTARERGWLEAQQRASISIWEVLCVERDRGIQLRDLFTNDERFVHEVLGSRSLGVRDAVLGRVVDCENTSVFCGMYPRSLAPRSAAEVVGEVRAELRARRGAISRDRLREPSVSSLLIEVWEDELEAFDSRPVPKLMNTDGDELLLTVDRFDLVGTRAEVIARVSRLEHAQSPDADGGAMVIGFVREGNAMNKAMPSTLLGRVRVHDARLTLETTSIKRADALRSQIETACAGLVRYRVRDHSDPEVLLERARNAPSRPPPPKLEGAGAIIQEYKAKHYASWLDSPIPALAGKTPRQAAKSARLRRELDLLLREIENSEGRLPEAERFDVAGLREQLGLDTGV